MHRPASIHRRFARLAAALLALVLLAGCADTVIHESESPYGKLFVTESNDGLRTLLFDLNGGRQSVVRTDEIGRAHV